MAPTAPGYSIEMLPESLDEFAFPNGPVWSDVARHRRRRMMVAVSEPSKATGRIRRPRPLRAAPGRALVASRRPRADPVLLILIVGLTTPVFLTTRNIGNVFSQTSVIAVLALGSCS